MPSSDDSLSETVLVTGASSGIGRELAHCFAASGSDCILLARTEDALHEVGRGLEAEHGVDTHVISADLSVPGAASDVDAELQQRGLTVDVLVNNAGFGVRGAFVDLDAEQQIDMIRVNVMALTHLTHQLLPDMVDRNVGGILNVASTAAFQPGPHMSVYYATKAYVLSFSEGLTEEVADRDVTVTCLAPGPTRTSFVDRAQMEESRLFTVGSVMSPRTVAEVGYDAFRNDRALAVPGWLNKIGVFATRLAPRSLIRKVTAWIHQ